MADSLFDFVFCEQYHASAVGVGFCVPAELLANHDWFRQSHVFGCVVHLDYHVNAHSAVPVANPDEAFLRVLLHQKIEGVGYAAEAFQSGIFFYSVAFLLEIL